MNGIKYLTDSQLAAFTKSVGKNKRDSLLFSLCLFVGARVAELSQIKLTDINEESFQIFIQGKKGGTARTYTMPGKLFKKYRAWIRERAKLNHAEVNPYLFISRYTMHDAPMTEQAIKNSFKKIAATAGLDKSFSIHSLRHTCAVLRIAAGCHVIKVQKWLRHKSLSSTMVYMDISSPEMKKDELEAAQTFDKYL